MIVTHTHVVEDFANPYLVCKVCGERARSFVSFNGQVPECYHRGRLIPCGHIGIVSICPTWSRMLGCACKLQLGNIYHPLEQKKSH